MPHGQTVAQRVEIEPKRKNLALASAFYAQEAMVQKLIATLGVMALLMFFQETARSVVATAADPFHAQGTTYGRF